MDIEQVEKQMQILWDRYQEIIALPNWQDLNEARAILYLLGQIYCEKIAVEAIERRLHLLAKPIDLIEFLSLVDGEHPDLIHYREDKNFKLLEDYYRVIKKFKNKCVGGEYYLDEEKFIELYNRYNPNKNKIGYRGKF